MKNIHKCPKKIWCKFTPVQQATYNRLRELSIDVMLPVGGDKLTKKDWDVISHNFACEAAWCFPSKKELKNGGLEKELGGFLLKSLNLI